MKKLIIVKIFFSIINVWAAGEASPIEYCQRSGLYKLNLDGNCNIEPVKLQKINKPYTDPQQCLKSWEEIKNEVPYFLSLFSTLASAQIALKKGNNRHAIDLLENKSYRIERFYNDDLFVKAWLHNEIARFLCQNNKGESMAEAFKALMYNPLDRSAIKIASMSLLSRLYYKEKCLGVNNNENKKGAYYLILAGIFLESLHAKKSSISLSFNNDDKVEFQKFIKINKKENLPYFLLDLRGKELCRIMDNLLALDIYSDLVLSDNEKNLLTKAFKIISEEVISKKNKLKPFQLRKVYREMDIDIRY